MNDYEPDAGAAIELDGLAELIRSRRSSMLMDADRSVPIEIITRLCELAMWAPNHKRTWPWRCAVFTEAGRDVLGVTFVADMVDAGIGDEAKRTKTLTKYRRAPAVIVMGCAPHDHPTFHDENRDAVAAGIQNLLLGATAIGLASFWSTAPVLIPAAVNELCGFEPETRIIGVVSVGWPHSIPTTPERPPLEIRSIT